MKKAKVSEVFQSLQGEGTLTGVKQVFVRFSDCNMQCSWCDTVDTQTKAQEYTPKGLFDIVMPLSENCHSVSLTGGEPLLQKDFLKDFLPLVKKAGLKNYLETNGILHKELKEIIEGIDFIAMDIKLPSSTKCGAFWDEHEAFLKSALDRYVFIKTVITSDTLPDDVIRAAKLASGCNRDITFVLQPNYFEMQNGIVKKCYEFQKVCLSYLTDVRVLPQMHKIMKLR